MLEISIENNEIQDNVITNSIFPFLISELDAAVTFVIAKERAKIPIYGIGINRVRAIKYLLSSLGNITKIQSEAKAQQPEIPEERKQLLVETLVSILSHCQELAINVMGDSIGSETVIIKSSMSGLKGDTIKVLANISFENKNCQDYVRESGGLALILSNCMYDDDNMFLREWSILALRNLCLENVDNQQFVISLKALAVPPRVQQQMNEQGFQVEITPEGKVTLVRKDPM